LPAPAPACCCLLRPTHPTAVAKFSCDFDGTSETLDRDLSAGHSFVTPAPRATRRHPRTVAWRGRRLAAPRSCPRRHLLDGVARQAAERAMALVPRASRDLSVTTPAAGEEVEQENLQVRGAPAAGLEPATLRLTVDRSVIHRHAPECIAAGQRAYAANGERRRTGLDDSSLQPRLQPGAPTLPTRGGTARRSLTRGPGRLAVRGRRFSGRWGDPDGVWRSIYVGESRLACYLDLLAFARADPQLQDELAGIEEAPKDAVAHPTLPAGLLPDSCRWPRRVGSALLAGWYAVPDKESLPTPRARVLALAIKLRLADVDAASIRLAEPRGFTQAIGRGCTTRVPPTAGHSPACSSARVTVTG
jgi:hypothetical protein